jgi:hypothetical protein
MLLILAGRLAAERKPGYDWQGYHYRAGPKISEYGEGRCRTLA